MIGLSSRDKVDSTYEDLSEAMRFASAHGISAFAFDGLEKAVKCNPEYKDKIPKPLLLQWCGQAVHQTSLFKKNWSAACSLALLLSEHGIEAVVLKGHSIADYSGINVPLVAVCNVPPVARCNVPPQKWLQ